MIDYFTDQRDAPMIEDVRNPKDSSFVACILEIKIRIFRGLVKTKLVGSTQSRRYQRKSRYTGAIDEQKQGLGQDFSSK